MSDHIRIVVAGAERQVDTGTTAADLFADDPAVIAARVGDQLVDLARPLADGEKIDPVPIDSDDGRAILRHSTAHVLAQAVQELFPHAKLGVGPPVENGFYYDFDVAEPFTPEDLKQLEKRMQRIMKERQQFVRRAVADDEARAELADEPYKLELIGLKGGAEGGESGPDGAAAEVGSGELTIYDNVRRGGEVAWKDLCRGPHLPTTKHIPAFKLMRVAAAYWRGDESNRQLQRIYGTAWESKDELQAYLDRLAEAERRDHRKLGAQLDLFSFPEEIGSGLAVWHPKGAVVRRVMEEYSRQRHETSGYEFVYTPHITKDSLFEQSGHLSFYKDDLYPPVHLDAEYDAEGNLRKPGQDYYLKPMNCPMHTMVFKSRGRSYRELPLRLFEFGMVYRYERSGVVHGLVRSRGFTQDDAHIFCTPEQLAGELASLLEFVLGLLRDYGLSRFRAELSTRPEKFVGNIEDWNQAEAALEEALKKAELPYTINEGDGAFYAPKIDVHVTDAIGRSWQLSTLQVDLQTPVRLDVEYTAADGTRQRPYMIHRALFGSIERFFGILLEHYAGAFPPWLAPVQVASIPIADHHVPYLDEVAAKLRERGVRVDVDTSDDRMQKKIRNAQTQKVPYMLLAGDDDVAQGAVSFRYRDGTQKNGVPVDDAIAEIVDAVERRVQV
ncbi:threonine--tRNA ligase [Actinobacteria bacterium YIM 96077]|uniref:Threonine--tRNA ligase n=1 Tax=Phytoactinopolyspora halophila TaxID=1981511 RepID=A0A329QZ55_9ACTN|nr:threonine--tRNA ligase [Phytoactinopolyspora halophila]AYY13352.1 threonine--tRNA ligase [Actinobacteria bacterium YIM 96077]RAW17413.1 threonine--tRNA ligase [Phytoactinopolyspora halophila]